MNNPIRKSLFLVLVLVVIAALTAPIRASALTITDTGSVLVIRIPGDSLTQAAPILMDCTGLRRITLRFADLKQPYCDGCHETYIVAADSVPTFVTNKIQKHYGAQAVAYGKYEHFVLEDILDEAVMIDPKTGEVVGDYMQPMLTAWKNPNLAAIDRDTYLKMMADKAVWVQVLSANR